MSLDDSDSVSDMEQEDEIGDLPAAHGRSLSSSMQARRQSLLETSQLVKDVMSASATHLLDRAGSGGGGDTRLAMSVADEFRLMHTTIEAVLDYWRVLFGDAARKSKKARKDIEVDQFAEHLIGKMGFPPAAVDELIAYLDKEEEDAVDREVWIAFCLTKFRDRDIARFHEKLMAFVHGGGDDEDGSEFGSDGSHKRSHSRVGSLIHNSDSADSASDDELAAAEAAIKQQMHELAVGIHEKVEEESAFFTELEEHAKRVDFASEERAPDWSSEEVAWFIDNTGHAGSYAKAVVEFGITGKMLLNDIGEAELVTDIGVSHLHIGIVLREIDRLRKMHSTKLMTSYADWRVLQDENERLQTEISRLKADLDRTETERAALYLEKHGESGLFDGLLPPVASSSAADSSSGDVVPFAEYERVVKEKVMLLKYTAREMERLRTACKIYQTDGRRSSMTPKSINPLDALASAMGYAKSD